MLETETEVLVSAATLAEALIVAGPRNVSEEMASVIDGLSINVAGMTRAFARKVAET